MCGRSVYGTPCGDRRFPSGSGMSPPRAESEINRRSAVRTSVLYQYETAATNRQVASVCIPGILFIWCSATYSDRQNVFNDSPVAYVRSTGAITQDCPEHLHKHARAFKLTDDRMEQFPVYRKRYSACTAGLWLTACQEGDSEKSFQCIDLPINFSPIYLFGSIENLGQHRLIYLDCHSHS